MALTAPTSRPGSWLARIPVWAQDLAGAVALTLAGWAFLFGQRALFERGPNHGGLPPDAFPVDRPTPQLPPSVFAMTAVSFMPLALRRRFPLSVLLVTSIAAAATQLMRLPPSLVFLAPLIALYTVGTLRERRVLVTAALVSATIALSVSLPEFGDTRFWAEFARIVAFYGVAAALGDATRNRRAYVAEVEQRALEAERTRDEEARRRVDEERLRIARELHDVTAHSLSIIAVQSGAAAHVIDSNPAEARRSLEAIRRTSKEALDELRAMLGVLRATEEQPDAPLAPVPGLARLGELVVPLTDAGLTVHTDIDGDLGDVPAVVEFSAYRIVQEALTNVVRHAGVCSVWVDVLREGDVLALSVEDDGATPDVARHAEGHGLAGMRERTTALGGVFEAGPRDGGGFRVSARLPLSGREDS